MLLTEWVCHHDLSSLFPIDIYDGSSGWNDVCLAKYCIENEKMFNISYMPWEMQIAQLSLHTSHGRAGSIQTDCQCPCISCIDGGGGASSPITPHGSTEMEHSQEVRNGHTGKSFESLTH